jgi:hypothetical protein
LASLSLCTKNASEIENITYPVLSTIDFQWWYWWQFYYWHGLSISSALSKKLGKWESRILMGRFLVL